MTIPNNEQLHQPVTSGLLSSSDELLKRIISPPGSSWNSFFNGSRTVPDDFMTERARQHQDGQESI